MVAAIIAASVLRWRRSGNSHSNEYVLDKLLPQFPPRSELGLHTSVTERTSSANAPPLPTQV